MQTITYQEFRSLVELIIVLSDIAIERSAGNEARGEWITSMRKRAIDWCDRNEALNDEAWLSATHNREV